MKKFKFLFVAILLACFGITQINAQADVQRGINVKDVYYEIDGVEYQAWGALDYQFVITPSNHFKWVAKGEIEVVNEWDGFDWIPLDYIPLPKKTVIYYDPNFNNEKVTITPSGRVTVVVLVKDPPWI